MNGFGCENDYYLSCEMSDSVPISLDLLRVVSIRIRATSIPCQNSLLLLLLLDFESRVWISNLAFGFSDFRRA
jgi:hypothetical protein